MSESSAQRLFDNAEVAQSIALILEAIDGWAYCRGNHHDNANPDRPNAAATVYPREYGADCLRVIVRESEAIREKMQPYWFGFEGGDK